MPGATPQTRELQAAQLVAIGISLEKHAGLLQILEKVGLTKLGHNAISIS